MRNFVILSALAMILMLHQIQLSHGSSIAATNASATKTAAATEVEEHPHALPVAAASTYAQKPTATGEIWQEDDREVLIRSERGAKNNNGANGGTGSGKKEKNKRVNSRKKSDDNAKNAPSCRYEKSQWSECNPESNIKTRTLSLKKGDEGCIQTRTIQKKCKKACRYEKGEWSKCLNGSMSRKDNVRANSDASCKPTREITKNCNKDKKQKKQDKNGRKSHA